jgi:hypothetical protein
LLVGLIPGIAEQPDKTRGQRDTARAKDMRTGAVPFIHQLAMKTRGPVTA